MAWAHSGWNSQPDDASKLAELNLFIQELSDAISSEMNSDGFGEQFTAISNRIAALEKTQEKLQNAVDRAGGMVSRIRLDKAT